ncbi:MAG: flagellar biosynthetic protein FliO [Oscillospiraceae bacterium]
MEQIFAFIFTIFLIILVVIFTYYATRWMGSRMGMKGTTKNIKIIDRIALAPDKSICIVDIAGKKMVIGVTTNAVNKICDLDDSQIIEDNTINGAKPQDFNFSKILKDTIKDTLTKVNDNKNNKLNLKEDNND